MLEKLPQEQGKTFCSLFSFDWCLSITENSELNLELNPFERLEKYYLTLEEYRIG